MERGGRFRTRTAGLETEILVTRTVISASRDLPGDRMSFKVTPPLLASGLGTRTWDSDILLLDSPLGLRTSDFGLGDLPSP